MCQGDLCFFLTSYSGRWAESDGFPGAPQLSHLDSVFLFLLDLQPLRMTPDTELLPAFLFIMTFHCSSKLSAAVLLLLGSPWGTAGLTPPCPPVMSPPQALNSVWVRQSPVLNGGTGPQLVPCHGVIWVPRESCVSPFRSLLCFSLSLFWSYLQKQYVLGILEHSESHEEASPNP